MPAFDNLPPNTGELLSDDVSEIISHRPNWIIQYGNLIIFLILAILLVFSWFIHYPEVVRGPAKLVAIDAPKMVVAQTEGKVENLLVHNEQEVAADQYLAFLQSTGEHDQVFQLQRWLQRIIVATQHDSLTTLLTDPLPALDQLGELQQSYQELGLLVNEMKQVLENGYYTRKRATLEQDLKYLADVKKNILEQKVLLEKDRNIQNRKYDAYKQLAKDKVIAPLELDEYQKQLYAQERGVKQADMQLTNSELSAQNKKTELLELSKTTLDLEQQFYSALLNQQNEINNWIQHYVIVAPQAGKVFFLNTLQENQLVRAEDELLFIQSKRTRYYAEMTVAQSGLGKMGIGQDVILKVASYPSEEYGFLSGKVGYISNFPNRNDSFSVRIDLPHGLKTSYNKELFFRNHLLTQTEVVTGNERLLVRLFKKANISF